jgi:hypothetical protein
MMGFHKGGYSDWFLVGFTSQKVVHADLRYFDWPVTDRGPLCISKKTTRA